MAKNPKIRSCDLDLALTDHLEIQSVRAVIKVHVGAKISSS